MENNLLNFLDELSLAKKPPEYDYLFTLSDAAASTLETEATSYRALSSLNRPGGLLDFCPPQKNLPLIVVPDVHARAYFVRNILHFVVPEDFLYSERGQKKEEHKTLTVFQALCEKRIRLLFVGDIMHSELRGRTRWYDSYYAFAERNYTSPSMTLEMAEGLSTLCMLMELKNAFPENVHILKGNHENILNERSPGNFPFTKFANEGELVRAFMAVYYGEDILMLISCFEKCLPLLAAFPGCIVSHAEPVRPFLRQEVIDGLGNDAVIKGLTWTENNAARDGSVQNMLKTFCTRKNAIYIGGHRPVRGNFLLRQNGLYVQIHNPDRQNIALVYKNKKFNPKKHIINLDSITELGLNQNTNCEEL